MFDRFAWYGRKHRRPPAADHEVALVELARIADDVDAGRVELPPRWKLDRPSPDVQVWTTPSGRRYVCDSSGNPIQ